MFVSFAGFSSSRLFRKIQTQENSIEMAFRKILIAFARYARCRNNENYDKLRNLWRCSVCCCCSGSAHSGRWRKGIKISLNLFMANPSPNVSPALSLRFLCLHWATKGKTCSNPVTIHETYTQLSSERISYPNLVLNCSEWKGKIE